MISDVDIRCSRCRGQGMIPVYRHVQNGVCFRCYGSGEDPRSIDRIERWLVEARKEYRSRLTRLQTASTPEEVAALEKEMSVLASIGKRNRSRLKKMRESCRHDDNEQSCLV